MRKNTCPTQIFTPLPINIKIFNQRVPLYLGDYDGQRTYCAKYDRLAGGDYSAHFWISTEININTKINTNR